MYYDRRGTDKTFQTKNTGQNSLNKSLCELRQTPCKKMYVCMYYTKNRERGVLRCVTYFRGSRDVTKCDMGSKLVQNSVTYFMDGPLSSKGPSIYDVHTEGGGGQAQVDGGPAPCGRPHRKLKLESTDVIMSSSHAKKLVSFFTRISSLDRKKWKFFYNIN